MSMHLENEGTETMLYINNKKIGGIYIADDTKEIGEIDSALFKGVTLCNVISNISYSINNLQSNIVNIATITKNDNNIVEIDYYIRLDHDGWYFNKSISYVFKYLIKTFKSYDCGYESTPYTEEEDGFYGIITHTVKCNNQEIVEFIAEDIKLIHYLCNLSLTNNHHPLVITEGKTDWKHFKAALSHFQRRKKYLRIIVDFLENEEDMGDAYLDKLLKDLAKIIKSERLIIGVFDSDTPTAIPAIHR